MVLVSASLIIRTANCSGISQLIEDGGRRTECLRGIKKGGGVTGNILIGIPLIHMSFIASLCCSPSMTVAVVQYAAHHTIII
jgi:hypothetical protein